MMAQWFEYAPLGVAWIPIRSNMAGDPPELDSETASDMAWKGHRERQLKALGIDPEKLDAGDSEND